MHLSTMESRLKHFALFPTLETKRLLLRAITEEDAQAIFEMRSSLLVNKYIGRKTMIHVDEANDLVQKTVNAYTEKLALPWAVQRKGDAAILGTCGLTSINWDELSAEIGGEMSPKFWGKHLAIEAFSEIIKFGMLELKLNRIEAKFDGLNRSVIALIEPLGFTKMNVLEDHFEIDGKSRDLHIYELVPENYKAYNPRG
jgi:[ribosomal protein S5]-alanine N-acetyltransferase